MTLSGNLTEKGRNFDCSKCKPQIMKIRRCSSPREDFNADDDPIFPIRVHKYGADYGYCPAKAFWDPWNYEVFKMLVIASETGTFPRDGGINDQEEWFVDLLAWFIPTYDQIKFASKAAMILPSK